MAHAARALGLGVMLGCMIESGLGIAAGCCVAPLCDHVDLDGNLLLAEDHAPASSSSRACSSHPSGRASVSERRLFVLAEGFSDDVHYGKTLRGVLRYRPEDVVAILDTRRAGESEQGVPIVRDVDAALAYRPNIALVGVATQGGRFPPEWRELLRDCIRAGLDVENGLHEFVADDRELAPLAAEYGVELRDLRRPPGGLDCPTGANLEVPAQIVPQSGRTARSGR